MEDIKFAGERCCDRAFYIAVRLAVKDLQNLLEPSAAFGFHDLEARWCYMPCIGLAARLFWETEAIAKWCAQAVDAEEKWAGNDRCAKFHKWAKDATKAGGGAAHAFAKAPQGRQAAVVPDGKRPPGAGLGTTSCPQAVVDAELDKWADTWRVDEANGTELPPWQLMEAVVPIFGEEVRAVCGGYRWRAGLSIHQLHHKHQAPATD
jgi:hypothetical protein